MPPSTPHRRAGIFPMRRDDVDEVVVIEQLCFSAPWPREVFLEELGRDWANIDMLRIVADGPVVAFVNYWIVEDEIHILNVATRPQNRRTGLARQLLEHVIARAHERHCRAITLEVRRSNFAALHLYRKQGFRPSAVRPKYYEDNDEDAVLMDLKLAEMAAL